MTPEYREWIDSYVKRHDGNVRGKCVEATAEMMEAFPELKLVKGVVECLWPNSSRPLRTEQHCWCEAPDGSRVDPTVTQFNEVLEYKALDASNAEDRAHIPVGRCLNCGDYIFADNEDASSGACSDRCYNSFAASLV